MTTTQMVIYTDRLPVLRPHESDVAAADAEACAGEQRWSGQALPTTAEIAIAIAPTWPRLPPLSLPVAYVLLVLLGLFGAHQFYLRNWPRALLYAGTLGCLGVGIAVDLVTLSRQVRTANDLRDLGLR